jgi:hypothetical protein
MDVRPLLVSAFWVLAGSAAAAGYRRERDNECATATPRHRGAAIRLLVCY